MGGMPALLPTSSALARNALMTSGPAEMLGHDVTVNGRPRSSPDSSSASCWAPSPLAIASLVPGGTDVGSGPVAGAAPADPVSLAQAARPRAAAPAAAVWRKRRRVSRAGPGVMAGSSAVGRQNLTK